MSAPNGRDRRRHVRVPGSWTVTASDIQHNGHARTFDATMLDISVSGVLLEAAITANLWTDKPLTIDLPGGVGPVIATVRHFVAYGEDGAHTTRWGVELAELSMLQRVLWARFVFTAAHGGEHTFETDASDDARSGRKRGSALRVAVAVRTA